MYIENVFGIGKPEVIQHIEKWMGIKLERLDKDSFGVGYQLDDNGEVVFLRLGIYRYSIELPEEIGQLRHLTCLSINGPLFSSELTLSERLGIKRWETLTEFPHWIWQLKNLQKLIVTTQRLTNLSPSIGELEHLQVLCLYENKLISIPPQIGRLKKLRNLLLFTNQLAELPKEIGQLQNLEELHLGNNKLVKLPKEIGRLQGLKQLDLNTNQLTKLPKEIANLPDSCLLQIGNNPLVEPPLEIAEKGIPAIREYFIALQFSSRPLNELKLLLIGDGGAGKTSLLKRLLGHPFDPNESQTHGINLNTLDLPLSASPHLSGDTVKLHCWDFGGQEIMHATHQFFLSKRSLYMLVLDSRREAKTDYWLKHIQSFGDKSPIILVINKIDENPSFDLPRQPLQKYNIAHFCRLSCRTGEGIDALTQAIQQTLPQVELVQTVFPSRWWQVKTALEQLTSQGRDYLSYDHYLDLCRSHEVTSESEQQTLIDFLHDLGLVIHFDQKLLRETNIINPKWLTEAVYKLITAPQVIQQQGTLFTRQLKELLDTRIYPSHKHDYLLELLKKFELGYAVGADQFLLPDVFPVQEPTFDFDYAHALHFVLDYDFLPKAVMSRFIVRMHQDIQNNLRWRTGVVIHDQKFDTTALIQATDSSKRLHIYVTGQQRRDYLAIILFVLRDIHHSFAKLTVKEKICLPDNPEVTVSYTHLLNLEKQGIATYTPEDSDTVYHVKDLLGTIHNPQANEAEMLLILRKIESVLGDKTEESVLQNVTDVIKINPNFFGIEVNVNELIKKLWKKRR